MGEKVPCQRALYEERTALQGRLPLAWVRFQANLRAKQPHAPPSRLWQ